MTLPTTPLEVDHACGNLSPPARLRLAADLVEAGRADLALPILQWAAESLRHALLQERYGPFWPAFDR